MAPTGMYWGLLGVCGILTPTHTRGLRGLGFYGTYRYVLRGQRGSGFWLERWQGFVVEFVTEAV